MRSTTVRLFFRQHALPQRCRPTSAGCRRYLQREMLQAKPTWNLATRGLASGLISPDRIVSSPHSSISIPEVPFQEYIFSKCDLYKDATAMIDQPTGRSYTFTQVKQFSNRVAGSLTALGYKKGDILAIHSVNIPEYPILILAASLIGVIVSPMNPAYTPGEILHQLKRCEARGIVTIPQLAQVVQQSIASDPTIKEAVKDLFVFGEAEGFQPFKTLVENPSNTQPPDVAINPLEDILVMPFSSGTMGLPKGVMLTHHNCVANLNQFRSSLTLEHGKDRTLGILPFYHIYGLMPVLFGSIQDGAVMVTLPRFDPQVFLETLQQHKITVLQVVPPIILFLAKHPVVANFDLSSLTYIVSGAAPLGIDLTLELTERLKCPIFQGYGLTETTPVISVDSFPGEPGTSGQLCPNTVAKIVDPETNNALDFGQFGEVCIQGPQVMKGYYKDPAATAEMIDKDGWLHTGDLGFFKSNGFLVIEDRLKDLIKYKGSQVPPAELEDLLLSHPGVQDVAVLGIPDEEAGELPKAFIVPKPGTDVKEEDITKFVEEKVASYKRLRGGVEFLSEIPKSPSGKILRRVLKQSIAKS